MAKQMFEVLEVVGKPGLTVGNEVLKPGQKFSREQWPYDEESLKAALKKKRCKEIAEKKKSGNSGNEKLLVKIDKMKANLSKLNPDTPGAKSLTEKIQELEKELDA